MAAIDGTAMSLPRHGSENIAEEDGERTQSKGLKRKAASTIFWA